MDDADFEMVFETFDRQGPIQVLRSESYLSLHFGNAVRQSCLDLRNPNRLVFEYLRGMALACALIPPDPAVLLLGLGGGSLARFVDHRFPQCRIQAVESRRDVVETARRFFQLSQIPRLHVACQDAQQFARESTPCAYSHLFIDLYDESGMCDAARRLDFLDACRRLLKSPGILSCNLWASDSLGIRRVYEALSQGFDGNALALNLPSGRNHILFAYQSRPGQNKPPWNPKESSRIARRWKEDYSCLMSRLIDYNPRHFGIPSFAGTAKEH